MELEKLLRNPTAFLKKRSSNNVEKLLESLKGSYDNLKTFEGKEPSTSTKSRSDALPSLLVNGFDAEQIWQQIELQNKDFRRSFKTSSDQPSTSRSVEADSGSDEGSEASDVEEDDGIEEEEQDEAEDGGEGEEEAADYDGDGEEDVEDEEFMDEGGVEDEEMDEGEDGEEMNAQELTAFEKQQQKLKKRIEEYEEQILSEKPWQLGGEITANRRPENSLLEEHLFYERATKLPPVITQETTQTLESIITQRIKDQAWDDVERKVKPINTPYVYKNDLVLEQEKSKISLSQVYEQEFLKKTTVMEEEKKNPKHEEIRKSMKELFFKLDLLTSSRYTPKPLMPELKVVNNMPSIRMEEVAPVSISDAAMLAPEEVKERRKGEMKAKEERSREDKKRELRVKKKKQSLKAAKRQKDEASKPTKTPRDKLKMLKKVGKIRRVPEGVSTDTAKGTSSKDFFSRLQKQVNDSVTNGKSGESKIRKEKSKKSGAAFKT